MGVGGKAGDRVTGLGRSEVQEVSKYSYQVHVLPTQEYVRIRLEDRFRGGLVVNGFEVLGDDCLIVTAHPER